MPTRIWYLEYWFWNKVPGSIGHKIILSYQNKKKTLIIKSSTYYVINRVWVSLLITRQLLTVSMNETDTRVYSNTCTSSINIVCIYLLSAIICRTKCFMFSVFRCVCHWIFTPNNIKQLIPLLHISPVELSKLESLTQWHKYKEKLTQDM